MSLAAPFAALGGNTVQSGRSIRRTGSMGLALFLTCTLAACGGVVKFKSTAAVVSSSPMPAASVDLSGSAVPPPAQSASVSLTAVAANGLHLHGHLHRPCPGLKPTLEPSLAKL